MSSKAFNKFPYAEHGYEESDSWELEKSSVSLSEAHEEESCVSKKSSKNRSEISHLEAELNFLNENIDNIKKICEEDLEKFRKQNFLKVIQIDDDDGDDDDAETNGQVSISSIENNDINHIDTLEGKYEKGFIINDIVALGRIRAVKKDNKIYIKTKSSPKFEITDMDKMLTK